MATLEEPRQAVENVLSTWQNLPGPEADFTIVPVSDRQKGCYLLLEEGWEGRKRNHNPTGASSGVCLGRLRPESRNPRRSGHPERCP
ncbi:element excision factor XisI family protein, partial [Armatimonas sp.]|uniref:element excision factor XisI family protein n=1 Tax=Armatimonas sp. TaxID=1872638 RepID=UPI00375249B7